MTKIMKLLRRIKLFLQIVWQEYEPASCGIPDPYRSKGRISMGLAWDVSRIIWTLKGPSKTDWRQEHPNGTGG